MAVQFLLFVMAILLLLIFWELSKINTRLRKTLFPPEKPADVPKTKES
jgi:hypothetical protein